MIKMMMMMMLLAWMNSASQGAAALTLAQTTISVKTSYNIAIRNGRLHQIPSSNYSSDLRHAMDSLASSVGSQLFGIRRRHQRSMTRTRRNTASSGTNSTNSTTTIPHVETPTTITDLVAFTCPNDGNTSTNLNDTCQSVIVAIPLVLPSSTWNQTGIAAQYLHELRVAIDMGSLELFLVQVNPNTILRILPTTTTTSNVPTLPTASPAAAAPSPSTSPFSHHFSSPLSMSSSLAPSSSTYPPVYISRAPPTSPTNNNRNTNNNNDNGNSNRAAAWGGAGGVVIFVLILVCLCCGVAVRKYPETFTVNQPL